MSNGPFDFSSGWDTLWAAISMQMTPDQTRLMGWLGLIIILVFGGKWLIGRARGSGGRGNSGLIYVVILGAILAAPSTLGIFFGVLDSLLNMVYRAMTA